MRVHRRASGFGRGRLSPARILGWRITLSGFVEAAFQRHHQDVANLKMLRCFERQIVDVEKLLKVCAITQGDAVGGVAAEHAVIDAVLGLYGRASSRNSGRTKHNGPRPQVIGVNGGGGLGRGFFGEAQGQVHLRRLGAGWQDGNELGRQRRDRDDNFDCDDFGNFRLIRFGADKFQREVGAAGRCQKGQSEKYELGEDIFAPRCAGWFDHKPACSVGLPDWNPSTGVLGWQFF